MNTTTNPEVTEITATSVPEAQAPKARKPRKPKADKGESQAPAKADAKPEPHPFLGLCLGRHARQATQILSLKDLPVLVLDHASNLANALKLPDKGQQIAAVVEAAKTGCESIRLAVPDVVLSSDKSARNKQLTALRKARAAAGGELVARLTGMATEAAVGDATTDKWAITGRSDGGMNAVHTRRFTVKRSAEQAKWRIG